ncbi:MAG: NADPH-dependent 7-cyano-7-deazaguanine reductase QueF [Gammaproteobacteria bacterium HGW-Gammaproteobacteria-14]|nr:MAG: NADPH-dependent 7-cyano-7-deazaguanine reductase QueF [Gammaproteobacteria bacterium HGW-Gammaproteobacteria-14]
MVSPFADTPLGRRTDYVDQYTPALLCPVPRWDAREVLELDPAALPFHGVDLWNAYEVSWLDTRGKPVVAMAEFCVPCNSRNLVESKSLKLYLNSFANSRFESPQKVQALMENDLSGCADGPVDVRLLTLDEAAREPWYDISGSCIDRIELEVHADGEPQALFVDQGEERTETLYSHLLRSLCPVTGQPDWATLIVRYTGAPISHVSLLRYVIAQRSHQGFHEQIIEQAFVDILTQCQPRQLSVYGRFTRRGGLDINPFRSNFESRPINRRVVRQ